MNLPRVFDQKPYESLNAARESVVTKLLGELKDKLGLHTAIDVGCGLGYFSGLLESLGLEVIGVDGREENVEECRRRFPKVPFHWCSAEDPAILRLGKFDMVFCFGLLYHLENPMLTIRHLKEMTAKLFLVEAVIQPGEEPMMALIEEALREDQGLNYIAFYPTESCLLKMFYRAGFSHAYTSSIKPNYPEYGARPGKPRIRTMLAASHALIGSSLLARTPEPKSPVHPCCLPEPLTTSTPVEKIRRFAKKPLREKVRTIQRIVGGKSD